MAEYLRSAYGDRAAEAYLKIVVSPLDKQALRRESQDIATERVETLLEQGGWWSSQSIRDELGYSRQKTQQTIQYLVRQGRIQKQGSGHGVQYAIANANAQEVA